MGKSNQWIILSTIFWENAKITVLQTQIMKIMLLLSLAITWTKTETSTLKFFTSSSAIENGQNTTRSKFKSFFTMQLVGVSISPHFGKSTNLTVINGLVSFHENTRYYAHGHTQSNFPFLPVNKISLRRQKEKK